MSEQANMVKEIANLLREGKKRLSHIAWENALSPGSKELLDLSEACNEAADILDQLQRETEPVPLTMDELRAMNGKPAYIVVIDKSNFANSDDAFDGWGMVRWSLVRMWDAKRADLVHVDHDFCENGKTWIAYARDPKGDATT